METQTQSKGKKGKATPPETKEQPAPATTAVVAKDAGAPPALSSEIGSGSWGSENLDMSDVKIPKILMQQGPSKLVAEGKASVGDLVRSTDNEIILSKKQSNEGGSLHLIPIMTKKTWRIMEKVGNKFEFRRSEPMTDANKQRVLEWEDKDTKTPWRADRVFSLFALLTSDIEREEKAMAEGGDPSAACIPVLIDFTRTSYNSGRDVATHFAHMRKFNKPAASWGLVLKVEAKSNDQGHFHVYTIGKGMKTSDAHLKLAYDWYKTITAGTVEVHQPIDDEVETTAAGGAGPVAAAEEGDDY